MTDLLGNTVSNPTSKRLPSYIGNHRKRLRERLCERGGNALADYEVLELILFRALPRQDVKPLAHRLLTRFETIGSIIHASDAQLKLEHGVGDAVIAEIRLMKTVIDRVEQATLRECTILSDWSSLLRYCRATLGFL